MKFQLRCLAFVVSVFALSLHAQDLNVVNPVLVNPRTGEIIRANPDDEAKQKSIKVAFDLKDDVLHAHFDVVSPRNFTKDEFSEDGGPYEADVVELFVSLNPNGNHRPYFEFEVSPLDQTLVVKIDEQAHFHEGIDLYAGTDRSFTHSAANVTDPQKGWTADLNIPLGPLGWDKKPESIFGNAFSILGQPGHRTYWSSFLELQKKPNFHEPAAFQALKPTVIVPQ